jgi:hypothetical protein
MVMVSCWSIVVSCEMMRCLEGWLQASAAFLPTLQRLPGKLHVEDHMEGTRHQIAQKEKEQRRNAM